MKKTEWATSPRPAILETKCLGLGMYRPCATETLPTGEKVTRLIPHGCVASQKNSTARSTNPHGEATYSPTEEAKNERRERAYGTTARMCWRLLTPCSWERREDEVEPLSCMSSSTRV